MEEPVAPYHHHEHLISLSKFPRSVNRALDRGLSVLGSFPQHRLIPIIIGINVDDWPVGHDVLLLEFLRQLAYHSSKHFVKFICARDWVIRAGVADCFYTDYLNLDTNADLIWTLSVTDINQVGLNISIKTSPSQQGHLMNLSNELKTPWRCVSSSKEHLCRMMHQLPLAVPSLRYAYHQTSQLHVIMIPNRDGTSYRSIPLKTITREDASYRFHKFAQQLRIQNHEHYELFVHQPSLAHHLISLIDAIRDNEHYGKNITASRDCYALAELLFSLYLEEANISLSSHDVTLFHISDEVNKVLFTYNLSVEDMHQQNA